MKTTIGRWDSGLVVERFLPPQRGHQYLLDFASGFVARLTVVVCGAPDDAIPIELRRRWVEEMIPGATIDLVEVERWVDSEHPLAGTATWRAWVAALHRGMAAAPDVLFTESKRGGALAQELGVQPVPVDWSPLASTAGIDLERSFPTRVRPHRVRRVAVLGPESTGKTTLCRDLARHYATVYVPEYLRTWLDFKGAACEPADLPWVVRGQRASEEALAQQAQRLLFEDTDPLQTVVYSQHYYGGVDEAVRAAAAEHPADLTLVLDADVPWAADPQRDMPHGREAIRDRCVAALTASDRRCVLIHGDWPQRLRAARQAVDALLAKDAATGAHAGSTRGDAGDAAR